MWQEAGYIFATPTGTPLDGTNVTKQFKRLLAESGLEPMRFHDLRHSSASLLLAQGVEMRLVMEALGTFPNIADRQYLHTRHSIA